MNVADAIQSRKSIRAFDSRPVDPARLREALSLAARAPSGGNLQPWQLHVLQGEPLKQVVAEVQAAMQKPIDRPDYTIYPKDLPEPWRSRRFAVGEAMYALLKIPREDKVARLKWFAEGNYTFFGAPVGVFCYVDRLMGLPQWSDLGMYLQTLMLALRHVGLDSCPQEAWSVYHTAVDRFLKVLPNQMLFCGMAIGYADKDASVNRLETQRAPLGEFATFHGF